MAPSPARPATLPFDCRLPNPPAVFVGRKKEIPWLREAFARGPVTVLAGDGGLGKSALALYVLHSRFPERVGSTVFVSLRDRDPRELVGLTVARALVRASGLRDFDWSEVLSSPHALGALAVDLADAHDRWVVLDDLHRGAPEEIHAFLAEICRYARRSRWIVTTRAVPPVDALAGRVLRLDAMHAADMKRLARALNPSLSPGSLEQAVAQAEGSPWRLRKDCTGDGSLAPGTPGKPSGALSEATRAFLEALSLLGVALPEEVLDAVTPRPSESLAALEQQGLLERTPQGVRLHELTRDLVARPQASPSFAAWRERAARALSTANDAALRVEGLRLLLEAGQHEEAAALLEASGEALLEAGYAVTLWNLLAGDAGHAARALEAFRLRCAVELGDADVLASVREPAQDGLTVRFLWARLLLLKGALPEGLAVAEEVRSAALAQGDTGLSFRAGLLCARCVANLGRMQEALERLDALAASDPLAEAELTALRAMALGHAGYRERALACASALVPRVQELPWPTRGRVGFNLGSTLYYLGRLRDARAILDQSLAADRGSIRFDVGRMARYTQACIATYMGDLDRARRALDSLAPYVAGASLLRPYVAILSAYIAFAAGDLDTLDRIDAELRAEALSPQLFRALAVCRLRLRLLRREGLPESAGAPNAAARDGGEEITQKLIRFHLGLRTGRIAPAEVLASLTEAPHPEARHEERILRAVALLLAGDTAGAIEEARAASGEARERGFGVYEIEARCVVADAQIVEGRLAALAEEAADLARMAAALPSPRFVRTAALYATLSAGPDPAVLEGLAGASATAPDVALRARALLGAAFPRDTLDELVLGAFLRHTGWKAPRLLAGARAFGAGWMPAWGLDEGRRRVWLPDGRAVDLSRYPVQWRLLCGLVERGGSATKEELSVGVWGERSYHPLLHDNRLRAAVLKLRRQIEDDPAAPSRLITTDDGYALGGPVRIAG